MKERITITLDKDLLNNVDKTIDEQIIKNRSHAIELLLSKSLKNQNLNKAILLVGGNTSIGLGKYKVPTCCSSINSRKLIEHIIISLKKYNISNFIIIGDSSTIKEINKYK